MTLKRIISALQSTVREGDIQFLVSLSPTKAEVELRQGNRSMCTKDECVFYSIFYLLSTGKERGKSGRKELEVLEQMPHFLTIS